MKFLLATVTTLAVSACGSPAQHSELRSVKSNAGLVRARGYLIEHRVLTKIVDQRKLLGTNCSVFFNSSKTNISVAVSLTKDNSRSGVEVDISENSDFKIVKDTDRDLLMNNGESSIHFVLDFEDPRAGNGGEPKIVLTVENGLTCKVVVPS